MHVNRKHKDYTSVEEVLDAETSMDKEDFCGWVNSAYTKVVETSFYSAAVKSEVQEALNVLDYSQFLNLHTYMFRVEI